MSATVIPMARLMCRSLKYDPGKAQGVQGGLSGRAITEPSGQRSDFNTRFNSATMTVSPSGRFHCVQGQYRLAGGPSAPPIMPESHNGYAIYRAVGQVCRERG